MSTPLTSTGPTSPEQSSQGVPVGGFRQWFVYIIDWIKALSPNGATTYDAGWVDITPSTPFGGTIGYTRLGKLIIVQGELTGAAEVGATQVGAMPAGFRPNRGNARGACYFNGGNPGVAHVTGGGSIFVSHQNGGIRNDPSFTIVYRLP